jgi:hypothetical protein
MDSMTQLRAKIAQTRQEPLMLLPGDAEPLTKEEERALRAAVVFEHNSAESEPRADEAPQFSTTAAEPSAWEKVAKKGTKHLAKRR